MKFAVLVFIFTAAFLCGCTAENNENIHIPELVDIPAGYFVIGSAAGFLDSFPPKKVYLSDYKIGKYEITAEQFCEFLNEEGNPDHLYVDITLNTVIQEFNGHFFVYTNERKDRNTIDYSQHAAHSVSFLGAQAYCKWLSKKTGKKFMLPSEAQWEKAAVWSEKNQNKFGFPWGNEDKTKEFNCYTQEKKYGLSGIRPVNSASESSSEYGCYHMADNVSEWCRDYYHKDYYSFIAEKDPVCEKKSLYRSIRGGSWISERNECLGIYRGYDFEETRLVNYGFRVVCIENSKK